MILIIFIIQKILFSISQMEHSMQSMVAEARKEKVQTRFIHNQLIQVLQHSYHLSMFNHLQQDIPVIFQEVQKLERSTEEKKPIQLILHLENEEQQLNQKNQKVNSLICRLLASCSFINLKILSLENNGIDDRCCKYLSKAAWKQLEKIDLSYNHITNKGTKYLVRGHWPSLQVLLLRHNWIGRLGFQNLWKVQWKCLRLIDVIDNRVRRTRFLQCRWDIRWALSMKRPPPRRRLQ